MRPLFLTLAVIATIVFSVPSTSAATLFGQVTEVTEGDLLKVMNMKRPVRIRLMAVDAPEKNQAFGDVARQHLADLVLGQNVVVEYTGIGRDGTIVGRVLLNNVDMNAQMIRDGAAWFDPAATIELGAETREIYIQSELAARNEKRGLWQTDDAVAPWEFVKAEEAKRKGPTVSSQSTTTPVKSSGTRTELTNENLINREFELSAEKKRSDMSWATSSEVKIWERFQPVGENFSVMIPAGGKVTREPTFFGPEQTIDIHTYAVREGSNIYTLIWSSGPATHESDQDVIKSMLNGFLRGLGAGFEKVGGEFSCQPGTGSDVSAGGFSGRSFNLSGCTIPGVAQVFTKATGAKRQVFAAVVFFREEDANVKKFMQSVTVNGVVAPRPNARVSASRKAGK